MTEKWTVGQKALIYDVNRSHPIEGVVEKVGRTRVHVRSKWGLMNFDKETGREGGKYDHAHIKTEAEAIESAAIRVATARLKELGFTYTGYHPVTYGSATLFSVVKVLEDSQ